MVHPCKEILGTKIVSKFREKIKLSANHIMKFKKETITIILSKMRKNEKSMYLTTDLYKPKR